MTGVNINFVNQQGVIPANWLNGVNPLPLAISVVAPGTFPVIYIDNVNELLDCSNFGLRQFSGYRKTESTTSRTLSLDDAGAIIYNTAGSSVTYTLDASLYDPIHTNLAFTCIIIQGGAGQITVTGSGGMNVNGYGGVTKTAGQYAAMSVQMMSATQAIITGQLA